MSKRILLALCLLSTLLLACAREEPTNKSTNSTNAPSTTVAPTNDAATTNRPAGEAIGVPDCDNFLAKYEACVTDKVPAANREQFRATLTQWRSSWKQLAANPQGRPVLEAACKSAMEQARTSMKAYNCTF